MILSLIGEIDRSGRGWDARTASPVIALVGSTRLDFRDATLGERETEVVVAALVGRVEVLVPDDMPVLVTGLTLLGSRRVLGESSGGLGHGADQASPDFHAATGPRLRLTVITGMGEVVVDRVPARGAPS